jgi:hypothetical protein
VGGRRRKREVEDGARATSEHVVFSITLFHHQPRDPVWNFSEGSDFRDAAPGTRDEIRLGGNQRETGGGQHEAREAGDS